VETIHILILQQSVYLVPNFFRWNGVGSGANRLFVEMLTLTSSLGLSRDTCTRCCQRGNRGEKMFANNGWNI